MSSVVGEDQVLRDAFRQHVDRLFVKPDTKEGRLHHAVVGIAGEVGEVLDCLKKTWIYGKPLNTGNLLEECGDILFYAEAVAIQGEFRLESIEELLEPRDPDIEDMLSIAETMYSVGSSMMKSRRRLSGWTRHVVSSEYDLRLLVYRVDEMLCYLGLTWRDAMLHNIEKLKLRYPDGYTDQAAIVRADKTEDPSPFAKPNCNPRSGLGYAKR
jgi:NTP pyrophosphatase (non-canonical NTP hydrolase)